MADEPLLLGPLVAVHWTTWLVRREGWSLLERRTYEFSPGGAPTETKYDRLTRGELLDLLDTLRQELDVGTEFDV